MRRIPADCVRTARANIRLAAGICGEADLSGLQRALSLLEASDAGMRQAEAEVRSGMSGDGAELRRETVLLKREIAVILRVIDGSAALCRGLSIRLGCTAPAYTAQGNPVAALPSAAACELRG